jgi:hypothetical protein
VAGLWTVADTRRKVGVCVARMGLWRLRGGMETSLNPLRGLTPGGRRGMETSLNPLRGLTPGGREGMETSLNPLRGLTPGGRGHRWRRWVFTPLRARRHTG